MKAFILNFQEQCSITENTNDSVASAKATNKISLNCNTMTKTGACGEGADTDFMSDDLRVLS
jgi:hypothetical protein